MIEIDMDTDENAAAVVATGAVGGLSSDVVGPLLAHQMTVQRQIEEVKGQVMQQLFEMKMQHQKQYRIITCNIKRIALQPVLRPSHLVPQADSGSTTTPNPAEEEKNNENDENLFNIFNDNDFAITDISHSRAVIEISGSKSKEVLKKGSPLNFNDDMFKPNNCVNTTYNGINILIDYLDDQPFCFNLYALRSFGGSFYHSITDSSLEYGYEGI